ncbi:MAG: hypothetical protein RIC87_08660 [Kiloniellales bacterium]
MSEAEGSLEAARAALAEGEVEKARKLCEQQLRKNKEDAATKHLLGEIQLLLGKYPPGFANLEARLDSKGSAPAGMPPLWDGSPLTSQTLFIRHEGGLEESLQFCRYAPVILRRYPQARLILEVPAEAQELIGRSFSRVDRVQVVAAGKGEVAPVQADLCLPLLSAPSRTQTNINNVPSAKAYLYAKQPRRLADEKELSIGISWRSSNPEHGKQYSLPLPKLARSLQHPGTRLINLQPGDTESECRHLTRTEGIAVQNPKGVPDGTALGPWSDVVAGCDLIVSVDSPVAHLAGALGKETWVLLSHPPHWRWLLDRDDTPWYPTLRLLRQTHANDWELMLPDLLDAIRERMAARDAA